MVRGEQVPRTPQPAADLMALAMHDEPVPQIPGYEGLVEIGRGGMGVVYKARHIGLDRDVAIKTIAPALAAEPSFAERFLREARLLGALRHPNIVGVYDGGTTADDRLYLVMEWVEGRSLRAVMAQPTDPGTALQIVGQLCDALRFAHEQGIVHRDIKPENVLLDERGNIRVVDFGLSKLVDSAHTLSLTGSRLVGTPHYMAPEQFEGPTDTVDQRADIYAVGVLAYELLTGKLPLGRFEPASRLAGTPPLVDRVVERALERDPSARFQSVSELQTAMSALPALRPRPSPSRPQRHVQWGWLALMGAYALVVIASPLWGASLRIMLFGLVAITVVFLGASVSRARRLAGLPEGIVAAAQNWSGLAMMCFVFATTPGILDSFGFEGSTAANGTEEAFRTVAAFFGVVAALAFVRVAQVHRVRLWPLLNNYVVSIDAPHDAAMAPGWRRRALVAFFVGVTAALGLWMFSVLT